MPPLPGDRKKPVYQDTSNRTERLAVNLFDLDRLNPVLRMKLFGGKLDLGEAIDVEKDRLRGPSKAVVFSCDLLTAATVCDVIRSENRREGDQQLRVYVFRKTWSWVPYNVVLTELDEHGHVRLISNFFPPETVIVDGAPPPCKPPIVGRMAKRGVP